MIEQFLACVGILAIAFSIAATASFILGIFDTRASVNLLLEERWRVKQRIDNIEEQIKK